MTRFQAGPTLLKESASQTAGPYVHIGLMPNLAGIPIYGGRDLGDTVFPSDAPGTPITLWGTVFDGADTPLRDAILECWQADGEGRYRPDRGWGRTASDPETGRFAFRIVKPGPVPFVDGRTQAPHISLWIVARGINLGLSTRAYFADETEANAADPVLTRLEHKRRVTTLLAVPEEEGYRFDIRLQGPDETVFFDI